MIQNVMYNKTDLIDVANENRVAAVQRARTRTLCVRRGLGRSLNKPEKTPVPHQRFGCFLQVVYTLALLASTKNTVKSDCRW